MTETTLNGYKNGNSEQFEEISVPVPWGKISGKWWGPKNVQPIIGIHGWQDNCGTFDNLAPLLVAKGHSFYCIDLPGHGLSSHIPQGLAYYLWFDGVHFLRRIVTHFKWNKIHIIGHSLGGGIAFLYASIFPGDVAKYVSIDISSPSVRNTSKMIAASGAAIDKFLDFEKKSSNNAPCYEYTEMINILEQAHAGSVDRQGCEILAKRGISKAPHKEGSHLFTRDPRLKWASLGLLSMEQVLEYASRITCEVLNIRADGGIKLDPPENYDLPLDVIEKNARRLVRVTVKGGHHVHLTDAQAVAPHITQFLCNF